jgi:endonuclease-8
VPEGDTIHRIARRLDAALVGRPIERAEAPSRRSPLHLRAGELEGRTLERVEARGKHLLLHFSEDAVVHSHLGMSGRWRVRADGRLPGGKPWLLLTSGSGLAAQSQGKLLRLTSAARARNDPALLELGPDPLAPGFDDRNATRRLLEWEPSEAVGAALLDQRLLAGVGNVIRIEACFRAAVSPWRRISGLDEDEAWAIVTAAREIMETTLREGKRPKQIYGRERLPCPRCGGAIERRGQGDDNRTTSWCSSCQR